MAYVLFSQSNFAKLCRVFIAESVFYRNKSRMLDSFCKDFVCTIWMLDGYESNKWKFEKIAIDFKLPNSYICAIEKRKVFSESKKDWDYELI